MNVASNLVKHDFFNFTKNITAIYNIQGKDEVPQDCQCKQSFRFHRQQGGQTSLHRGRR